MQYCNTSFNIIKLAHWLWSNLIPHIFLFINLFACYGTNNFLVRYKYCFFHIRLHSTYSDWYLKNTGKNMRFQLFLGSLLVQLSNCLWLVVVGILASCHYLEFITDNFWIMELWSWISFVVVVFEFFYIILHTERKKC